MRPDRRMNRKLVWLTLVSGGASYRGLHHARGGSRIGQGRPLAADRLSPRRARRQFGEGSQPPTCGSVGEKLSHSLSAARSGRSRLCPTDPSGECLMDGLEAKFLHLFPLQ